MRPCLFRLENEWMFTGNDIRLILGGSTLDDVCTTAMSGASKKPHPLTDGAIVASYAQQHTCLLTKACDAWSSRWNDKPLSVPSSRSILLDWINPSSDTVFTSSTLANKRQSLRTLQLTKQMSLIFYYYVFRWFVYGLAATFSSAVVCSAMRTCSVSFSFFLIKQTLAGKDEYLSLVLALRDVVNLWTNWRWC